MDNINFDQQVFILNGQPVLLQRDSSADNSVNNIINASTLTLQSNELQESNVCNIDVQSFNSNQLESIKNDNLITLTESKTDDGNNINEFVAYVGESDDESTIHLTLEQAAQLGLQIDTIENDSKPVNSLPVITNDEVIRDNSKCLTYNLFSKASDNDERLELAVFNDKKTIDNVMHINDNLSKDNIVLDNSAFKLELSGGDSQNVSLENGNQQLTLIPHLIDGTLTYSLLLNNSNEDVLSKDTLDNCIGSSVSEANGFNDSIKTFTTCSNLATLVPSNSSSSTISVSSADNVNTSQNITLFSSSIIGDSFKKISNTNALKNEILSTTLNQDTKKGQTSLSNDNITILTPQIMNDVTKLSQTNSGNSSITLLSSTVIGSDSIAKLSPNNFTSISDLINKNNSNYLANKTVNSFNLVSNYQPITIAQLLGDEKQVSDKNFLTTSILDSGINNVNKNSTNITINSSNMSCVDFNSLINTPCNNSNNDSNKMSLTTGNNENSLLMPVSLSVKTSSVSSPISTTTVSNANKLNNEQKLKANDKVCNLVQLKCNESTTNLNTADKFVKLKDIYNNVNSSKITTKINMSPLLKTSSNPVKVNKIPIGRSMLQPNILRDPNKNTAIKKISLTSDDKNDKPVAPPPVSTSSSSKETTKTTSTVIGSCRVSSVISNASTTPITNSTSSSVSSSETSQLTTVKSVKSANTAILPKQVTAALNKLPPVFNNKSKPLGSSENPIQLIQQGQTFHSAQALTENQLQQITAILQKNSINTQGTAKNILFDSETNTRIIYRVVYPEEFDLKETVASGDDSIGRMRKRGRPTTVKSHKENSENLNNDDNASNKRKQPLPRTRSGRLSRPPRYMVRDYKRIKRSELDDSDGAYSDYQSENEEEDTTKENNLLPGLSLPQKRNISSSYRCPTCNKIYLGYRRMSHHFDKHPDHGTKDYLMKMKKATENKQTQDGGTNINTVNKNYDLSSANLAFSSASSQRVESPADSISNSVEIPSVGTNSSDFANELSSMLSDQSGLVRGSVGIGYGKKRGRKRILKGNEASVINSTDMRLRLKELLDLCDVTEVVQIAGPAVCRVLSTWEMLMLRIDSKCTDRNRISILCDEVKQLIKKLKDLASLLFQPDDDGIKNASLENGCVTYEMDDKNLSNLFGVPCGVYKINESLLKSENLLSEFNKQKSESCEIDSPNDFHFEDMHCDIEKQSTVTVSRENLDLSTLKPLDESSRCDINQLTCSETNLNSEHVNSVLVDGNDVPSIGTSQFLLSNDNSLLCNRGSLDSVDQLMNEELKNLTAQNHQAELIKEEVDELMKNFSALEQHHRNLSHNDQNNILRIRRDALDPSEDDLMGGFTSITNQRSHVSASTEDLIKSLENLSSELKYSDLNNPSDRQDFINTNHSYHDRVVDHVNSVNVVDTLDFDVLSQDFHDGNSHR